MSQILIVDDAVPCLEICRKILAKNGYDVILAKNGLEAIDALRGRAKDINIILMDIYMKRLGGIKATWRIKKKYPHIKVIAVTSESKEKYMIMNQTMDPFDGYLEKPYKSSELIGMIDDVINNRDELSMLIDEMHFQSD